MLSHAVLAAMVAIACYGVHQYNILTGLNGQYYKHHPGVCRRVAGIKHGSEDIHMMSDGKVFISSGFASASARLMKKYLEKHNVKGKIFLFDFKNPSTGAVELKIKGRKEFNPDKFWPHGISVLEDVKKGEHLLYVVNHPNGLTEVVEKFQFSPVSKTLVHLKSFVVGPPMNYANDLALVAEDQFYVSNYVVSQTWPFVFIERTLPLRIGGVFFFNGTHAQQVIPGISMPNGVFLSRDQRLLYVTSYRDRTLQVYRLDPASRGGQLVQTVQLYGRVDNVQLSQSGNALLIGAQPNYITFREHLTAATPTDVKSPSSVVRLPLDQDGLVREDDVTELFYDPGDLITGSSSAAIFEGQLLIGSVLDSLVHCELSKGQVED